MLRARRRWFRRVAVRRDQGRTGINEVACGAAFHDLAQAEAHGPCSHFRAQVFLQRATGVPRSLERLRRELMALAVLRGVVLGVEFRVGELGVEYPQSIRRQLAT